MPRWIDLKERQPKHGQLVVVRIPRDLLGNPTTVENTTLRVCGWGESSDWRYPPEQGATHWYPIPALHEKPDPELSPKDYPLGLILKAEGILQRLKDKAPRIRWSVYPDSTFYAGPPDYFNAWRIRAMVELDAEELQVETMVMDRILSDDRAGVTSGALEHIIMEIAYKFAQEMLK